MKFTLILPFVLLLLPRTELAADEPRQTVAELWSDFDPRKDPLEVEVVREWKEDGGVYRYVRYLIGSFHGKPAKMAAFYGFPDGAEGKLPAVMHMHGGGQRACMHEVKTYVDRGYAALSVNWGASEMEDTKPGDPSGCGSNRHFWSLDGCQSNDVCRGHGSSCESCCAECRWARLSRAKVRNAKLRIGIGTKCKMNHSPSFMRRHFNDQTHPHSLHRAAIRATSWAARR